jgi:hypothetical protein
LTNYSSDKIQGFWHLSDSATNDAAGRTLKGKALEDLVCYLFEKVPGIPITERNQQNAFQTEEIDLAFWNDKHPHGFRFLPDILLVECKNWSQPVDSASIAYFVTKIVNKGKNFGILIAANGITGPDGITRANFEISAALLRGINVIIITRAEIETFNKTDDLLFLCKKKLCRLALTGAAQIP